jgi:hypothetical protein
MDRVLLHLPLRSHRRCRRRRRAILLAARFFDYLEAWPNVFGNCAPAYLDGE